MAMKCEKCGKEMPLPDCCDKPMHIKGKKLFCHKGAMCMCGNAKGKSIPEHCGQPMTVA